MLYYVEDERVLYTDNKNWNCNINFLRTLYKSKLENFIITYLQTEILIQNCPLIAELICLNHYGQTMEIVIEVIMCQYLQKAYILTTLHSYVLRTGN